MVGTIQKLFFAASLCFALTSQGQIQFALKKTGRKIAQQAESIHVSTSFADHNRNFAVVKKGRQKKFPLQIPNGYSLSIHHQVETSTHVVLVYQYDASDSGGSQLLIINKENLELVHREIIGSFNISEPLIHFDVVLVAAAGYVGEFEIATGKKNWVKSNLFGRPYYFDGLLEGESIEVNGDLVRFGPSFSINRRTQQIIVESENQ